MGLGERCDEIVRLIDETLAALAADPADAVTEPSRARWRGDALAARRARPSRAASGF